MRLLRFQSGDEVCYGAFRDGQIQKLEGVPFESVQETGESFSIDEVSMLAPVTPSKIVAVGLNYTDHALELGMDIPGEPILFLKAPSTVVGPGGVVVYPPQSGRVDYEAELAVVIKSEAHFVSEESAGSFILGYTCSLDMTARDLQKVDGQWTRAKNFDSFCPIGPWVDTEVLPQDLSIELRLNGDTRQSSRTSQMIFSVPFLVSYISHVMTLNPGDVIMTGTPPGVGEVSPGDIIEISIEDIGTLSCSIVLGNID